MDNADFGIVQAKHASGMRMVRPDGELDISTAPALREFVERLCDEGVDRVFLDLSRLEFVDSRGLGALVELERLARARGLDLTMGGASPTLLRLFEISGIGRVVRMVDVPEYEPPASVH